MVLKFTMADAQVMYFPYAASDVLTRGLVTLSFLPTLRVVWGKNRWKGINCNWHRLRLSHDAVNVCQLSLRLGNRNKTFAWIKGDKLGLEGMNAKSNTETNISCTSDMCYSVVYKLHLFIFFAQCPLIKHKLWERHFLSFFAQLRWKVGQKAL